jgi:hypothetical protein
MAARPVEQRGRHAISCPRRRSGGSVGANILDSLTRRGWSRIVLESIEIYEALVSVSLSLKRFCLRLGATPMQ